MGGNRESAQGGAAAPDELALESETLDLLNRASPTNLEQLLASQQPSVRRKPRRLTRPGTALRHRIPVRTFRDWDDAQPGFVAVNAVAHCGPTSAGFHLWIVVAVPDWNGACHRLGIDCDNGSEFINRGLYACCQDQGITLTRSRPYRKNDAAHVEQKNGAVISRVAGHQRYSSAAAFRQLRSLYSLLRLQANCFEPVRLLSHKQREGSRIQRHHDTGQTPYQRRVASGLLTEDARRPRNGCIAPSILGVSVGELSPKPRLTCSWPGVPEIR